MVRWHQALHDHVARTKPRHFRPRLTPREAQVDAGESLRLLRKAEGFVLIAELNAAPVGFLMAELASFPTRHYRLELKPHLAGHIDGVFVELNARNRGIGTALFREAEDRLRAMGCDNIELGVVWGNDVARRFYRDFGFEEVALRLRKDVSTPPADWEEVRRRRRTALMKRPAKRGTPPRPSRSARWRRRRVSQVM